jgi:hypothetical protein
MVILGLLLLLAGVALVLVGVFSTGYDLDKDGNTHVAILNNDTTPEFLFVMGMVASALILFGLWSMKVGAKQGWRHRQERKRLDELSAKLDRAEAERRAEEGDDRV